MDFKLFNYKLVQIIYKLLIKEDTATATYGLLLKWKKNSLGNNQILQKKIDFEQNRKKDKIQIQIQIQYYKYRPSAVKHTPHPITVLSFRVLLVCTIPSNRMIHT